MAESQVKNIFFVVFVDAAFQFFFLLQKIHKIFVISMNVSQMYLLHTMYYYSIIQVPESHNRHDLYRNNLGVSAPTAPLPLPPTKGLPFKINTYQDVDEPVFNPDVHLNLEMPKFVRVLPDFEPMDKTPCFKNDQNGSRFAYSAPFQVMPCRLFFRIFFRDFSKIFDQNSQDFDLK